jgi:hypothetical protein
MLHFVDAQSNSQQCKQRNQVIHVKMDIDACFRGECGPMAVVNIALMDNVLNILKVQNLHLFAGLPRLEARSSHDAHEHKHFHLRNILYFNGGHKSKQCHSKQCHQRVRKAL